MARGKVRPNGRPRDMTDAHRPDHGANGPAMRVRASRIVETIEAGVSVRRMEPSEHRESYPLDHYEAASLLTERQINAGRRLALCYSVGFGRPRVVPGEPGGTVSEERAERQTVLMRAYCDAMACVPAGSQATLSEIVRGEWPTATGALLLIRMGLDCVADHWGLPRVVTGEAHGRD